MAAPLTWGTCTPMVVFSALPAGPARVSPPSASPLALRPKTEIVSLTALPPGPARAAPEALPRIPMDVQFAFFCEEEVATHVAAEPMAMARPLVLPTGLETGVLWAPPHFLPIAIDRLSKRPLEPETVRHPSLFTNSIPLPPEPLSDWAPSVRLARVAESTLLRPLDLALAALARIRPFAVSLTSGPAPPAGVVAVPLAAGVLEPEPALPPLAVVPAVPDWGAGADSDGFEEPPFGVEPLELVDTTLGAEAGVEPVVELLTVTVLAWPAVPALGVELETFTVAPPPLVAGLAATVVGVVATVVGVDATVVGGAATVVGGAGATVVVGLPASAPLEPEVPAPVGAVCALAGRAHSSRTRPRASRASAAHRAGRTPSVLRLIAISPANRLLDLSIVVRGA